MGEDTSFSATVIPTKLSWPTRGEGVRFVEFYGEIDGKDRRLSGYRDSKQSGEEHPWVALAERGAKDGTPVTVKGYKTPADGGGFYWNVTKCVEAEGPVASEGVTQDANGATPQQARAAMQLSTTLDEVHWALEIVMANLPDVYERRYNFDTEGKLLADDPYRNDRHEYVARTTRALVRTAREIADQLDASQEPTSFTNGVRETPVGTRSGSPQPSPEQVAEAFNGGYEEPVQASSGNDW